MAARFSEVVRWVALSRLYVGDRQALIFPSPMLAQKLSFLPLFGSS
jgi:hypothetical protein